MLICIGANTFGGRPLHSLNSSIDNPYVTVMKIATKFFECDMDSNVPLCYFGNVEAKGTCFVLFYFVLFCLFCLFFVLFCF